MRILLALFLLAISGRAQILTPILYGKAAAPVVPQTVLQTWHLIAGATNTATIAIGAPTSNTTAGSTIACLNYWPNETDTVSSATDSSSNTYTEFTTATHAMPGAPIVVGSNVFGGFGVYATGVAGGVKPTITITLNNIRNDIRNSVCWEIAAGSGTPFDVSIFTDAGGTTLTTDPFFSNAMTTTVKGDVVLATMLTTFGANVGTVTAGTGATLDGTPAGANFNLNGEHWIQTGTSNNTVASFNATSPGSAHIFIMAVALKPATPGTGTCTDISITDWGGAVSGTNISAANMFTSTHGGVPGYSWTVANSATNITFNTAGYHALFNPAPTPCFPNPPTQYVETGNATTVGMQLLTTSTTIGTATLNYPTWTTGRVSTIMWFSHDIPDATSFPLVDLVIVEGTSNNDFIDFQIKGTGTQVQMCNETPNQGTGNNCIHTAPSTAFAICLDYTPGVGVGAHHAMIFDASGNQIGSTFNGTSTGTNQPVVVVTGRATNGAIGTFHIWFDKQMNYYGPNAPACSSSLIP